MEVAIYAEGLWHGRKGLVGASGDVPPEKGGRITSVVTAAKTRMRCGSMR